ncbi:MAG: betaine/proline/choline family ABC transporter ATP-binding protein, partial [Burkholderiaceae bacterium]|nr:betaine/proline/choline family ABC transporter ATP-binding protein [Burkholderiaceae bacterium]
MAESDLRFGRSGVSISIRHLYKLFGPTPAKVLKQVLGGVSKPALQAATGHVLGLRDICIDMDAGGIQVVMGLSGSGKSTLIRHINRLIEPTSGQVLVDGQDVLAMAPRALRDFRRHQTAMVFQRFALFPHRTVMANVQYGLEVQGMARKLRELAANQWIERVGLNGFERSFPHELSGGMQQRVGLARALAIDAPVLLMDEPFSALDPLIRNDMQTLLLDLQQEIGKTIVFITHDLDEALRLGDRIAVLRDGGVVQQGGAQDILLRPADSYVAAFVKEVNRGKVIRCRALMTPGAPVQGPSIRAHELIEVAARIMATENAEAANVTNAKGQVLGTITQSAVVEA